MINYFLGISLLLNSILIMVVIGIIPFFLYISLLVNIGLILLIRLKINEVDEVRDDTMALLNKIDNFSNHVENLHELESFYGDQVLQGLINHSKEIINDIIDIQEKYDDVEVTVETYDEEESTEKEE